MIIKGKIVDGLGNASFWVKKIEEVFIKKYGTRLFHGTLNVKLEEEYNLENYYIIEPEEYGGTQKVFVQECVLLGNKSYIVRAEKTSHALNIVEIVSDINFREKYILKNEDKVEIIL